MVQALMFQLIDFERLDRFANATQQHKYSASKAATGLYVPSPAAHLISLLQAFHYYPCRDNSYGRFSIFTNKKS